MIWRNFLTILLLHAAALPASARVDGARHPDSIGDTLSGEFAFQSGRYVEAAQHYLRAAQASTDPALVERAARMAVLSGDESLLAAALSRWQQLKPDSPVRAGLALRLALRGQQPVLARSEAERLLTLGGAGLAALRESIEDARGPSAVAAGQLLRELALSQRLPADFDAWLTVTGLLRKRGDQASARLLLERMPGLFPGEPRALLALALWQREQGDVAAALATLGRAVPAQVPRDADRRQFASEYLQHQRYGQAERWLAAAAQDGSSYRQRLALLEREKTPEAIATLSRHLVSDRGLSAARRALLLGLAAELIPDWREAERRYRDVRNGPERIEAQLRLAFVQQKQGRDRDALRLVRKLQRDLDNNADVRRDAYALEAQMLRLAPEGADIAAYGRGLEVFKDDAKLLYGRSMRLIDTGKVDLGLADLRRILDAEPEHPAALNAYGYTLAERKQRYDEALPYVQQALRLQPESAAILDSLGFIRLRQGRHAEALPLLQRAWQYRADPEVAAHYGELLWLLGRRGEAAEIWRSGLALEPANKQILALQAKYRP